MTSPKFFIKYALYGCENSIVLDSAVQYVNWSITMEDSFGINFKIIKVKNFMVIG